MKQTQTARIIPSFVIIAIMLMVGFGLSLIELPPTQPGWWKRGLVSGGALVVGCAVAGLVCTWLGNLLPFSKRINGAVVMAIGFTLLRLSFHLAGLSNEDLWRSIGSAMFLGAIVGAAVGPRFKTWSAVKQQNPNVSDE